MAYTRSGYVPPTFLRGPRVVGAIRLSKETDASTSEEVQEEMVTEVCTRIGGTFIDIARDMDVSALKTTPWEREKLAYWLERPDEWDVMVWQRMDRAVRSMADMADLGRYAKQHGKRLIFASGPGGAMLELDFSSPMSELIMLILAFAAQLEGQTIMERTKGAAAHLQSLGRWPGGPVPYGWHPVRKMFDDGKEGWWLGEHRETANIRRAAIARAIASHNYSEIQAWLKASEAVTPKNHRNRLATPPREDDPESEWGLTTVRDMLLSPLNRGHLVKKDGTVVRDADGAPVLQADALVDDPTWYALDEALKLLALEPTGPRRKDAHPLLGVIVCGTCEANMYVNWYAERTGPRGKTVKTGAKIEVFRCFGKLHEPDVPTVTVHAAPTLEYVEAQFLAHVGPFRRTQVVRTPGIDHRPEMADLEAEINELTSRMARMRGSAADAVERQILGRSDRLDKLAEQPFIPPQDTLVELDTTWADDWHATDNPAVRRQMLLSAGVRVKAHPATSWRPPIEERLTFHIGEHVDPEQDALEDALHQATL